MPVKAVKLSDGTTKDWDEHHVLNQLDSPTDVFMNGSDPCIFCIVIGTHDVSSL
ncbi:hypothetical protein KIN20_032858 [Parelaphostrongylus tenuis]|uniref:Uncharacterized protein n=1 Tax=Parelaphostrongylus tenuis TaxID=148309 RepID=A0AAD5R7M5_PARTN|nr:hypothetical protein KIN20_032858 [Parelaphostrongylus tenuis]